MNQNKKEEKPEPKQNVSLNQKKGKPKTKEALKRVGEIQGTTPVPGFCLKSRESSM